MKKFVSIICLFLSLFTVMGCFTACNTTPAGGESSEESKETDAPTEPPKPAVELTLASGGKCSYTVVRPELGGEKVVEAAQLVKETLSEMSGDAVSISEDFLYGDLKPGEYEILIGQTNREESVNTISETKYDDYTVAVVGKKIVITSYNDEQVLEAAKQFLAKVSEKDGKLIFSSENDVYYKHEYPLSDVKVGGKSLMGYSMVYPTAFPTLAKSHLEFLQKAIIEVSGIYLPIYGETKKESDKEILFGSTKRVSVDTEALGKYGYTIKNEGEKIVVATNDNDFTMIRTIANIIEMAGTGEIKTSTGKLEVSETPILTAMCFSDVHNNFDMLTNKNNTGDYVVRRNVDWMIDHILETEGAVDVALVGGDYMSDYPNWNSSGRLPYKFYLGFKEKTVETFNRLTKDNKVMYVAGNHDYAQGESKNLGGPGTNGTYNSSEFYFTGPMKDTLGELADGDMFVKIGEHTGEKYLLGYHYVVNGIHFIGFSPDPDIIWSAQAYGFSREQLDWLDAKLKEIDPHGTEIIFVNCHYALSQRVTSQDLNNPYIDDTVTNDLEPVLRGHKNLFYLFGHWHANHSYHTDYTVKNVLHYNTSGKIVGIDGDETESTKVMGQYSTRSFTAVWMGGFRMDWSNADGTINDDKFNKDMVTGSFSHPSTGTPRMAQGMYFEVFEDRVVFTMKNIGDYPGFSTEDVMESYTVYLYK